MSLASGHERTVPLNEDVVHMLKQYRIARGPVKSKDSSSVVKGDQRRGMPSTNECGSKSQGSRRAFRCINYAILSPPI